VKDQQQDKMIKEGDANLVDLLTKKIGKAQITIEEL